MRKTNLQDIDCVLDLYRRVAKAPGGIAQCPSCKFRLVSPRVSAQVLDVFEHTFMSRWHLKSRVWKHLAADHHLCFFKTSLIHMLCQAVGFSHTEISTIYPRSKYYQAGVFRPILSGIEELKLAPWIELVARR